MSEIEKPLLRMAYLHISGEVFVIAAICPNIKPTDGGEIVVLSSLLTGKAMYIELSKFWDKHPKTGVPRFQLVTVKSTDYEIKK